MDKSWNDNNVNEIMKLSSFSLRGSIKPDFISFEFNELNIFSFSCFDPGIFETLMIVYISRSKKSLIGIRKIAQRNLIDFS